MVFPDGMTRVAQPPGGVTSFSFNDGTDRRVSHLAPSAEALPSMHITQPPGGRGSFSFDDGSSMSVGRGGGEQRRHTNGLRRIDHLPHAAAHDTHRLIPPGGHASLVLDDNSTGAYSVPTRELHSRAPCAHAPSTQQDALSHFVEQQQERRQPFQPPPAPYAYSVGAMGLAPPAESYSLSGAARRTALAPPGGHSSFSLGWGGDGSGNHHAAYHGRVHQAGTLGAGFQTEGGVCGFSGAPSHARGGLDAFRAQPVQPVQPVTQPCAHVGRRGYSAAPFGFAPADGGGLHGGRSSSRVSVPPGGYSSFTFG